MSIRKYALFVLANLLISGFMFGGFCEDFLCYCCRRNSGDENELLKDQLMKNSRYVDAVGNPVGLIVYRGKSGVNLDINGDPSKNSIANTMFTKDRQSFKIYTQPFCSLQDFANRQNGVIDQNKIYGLSNPGAEYTESSFLLMPLIGATPSMALIEFENGRLEYFYDKNSSLGKTTELAASMSFVKNSITYEEDVKRFLLNLDSYIAEGTQQHGFPVRIRHN